MLVKGEWDAAVGDGGINGKSGRMAKSQSDKVEVCTNSTLYFLWIQRLPVNSNAFYIYDTRGDCYRIRLVHSVDRRNARIYEPTHFWRNLLGRNHPASFVR